MVIKGAWGSISETNAGHVEGTTLDLALDLSQGNRFSRSLIHLKVEVIQAPRPVIYRFSLYFRSLQSCLNHKNP